MIQWAIEPSQFDIEYLPKTAIKAQALADFIAEFTFLDESSPADDVKRWTIQTDGLSAQKRHIDGTKTRKSAWSEALTDLE